MTDGDVKTIAGKRSVRRHHIERAKAKVVRKQQQNQATSWSKARINPLDDPAWVGKQANVHSCACSCAMCANREGWGPISAMRRERLDEEGAE